ncbi:MAG: RagB/SusD family nutrient uptake outer membrane protein [Dysgonamonadaceae bacterium]|nr:RagB/SusD family nutrient uptake outer membrane protein [Dysgonamonadaceae bacterium]
MKKTNIYIVALLSIFFVLGCNDFLDVLPEGGTVTEDQKNAAIEANPGLLAADIAAMNANMIAYCGILGPSAHNDFGYAAACLYMDSNGADMPAANLGYNWFSPNSNYSDRVYTSTRTTFMWNLFYKQIASANIVLSSVDPETENPTLRGYMGQALAVRAFDYLHLAQLFQFTYKGHEQAKCVPIVTEKTTAEEAANNPRATVEDVYKLIIDDLNKSIGLLDGFKRLDKGYIDQSVAYGLRARANLVMNNWAAAANDADSALILSGAVPYTLAQASAPAFYDANDRNVLWANIITENNDIVLSGIINMPSHLCTFYTDGYIGVGVWKKINKPLYDRISAGDIRKQWWLNENLQSTLVSAPVYDEWRKTATAESDFGAYTNVKFGADGGTGGLYNQTPAQDWFLMRAEELILIRAEGLALSSNPAAAKALLEEFVNKNRMVNGSGYVAPSGPDALQEEIWLQRRIELWGEGFSFFDIMRLKKPVTRVENGVTSFPDAWQFNIPAEAPILRWLVPKSEIEANAGIREEDNNEKVNPPKP